MKTLAVIPARFASTRFPGKPLAKISGKPMIQCVYERTKSCSLVDEVMVATDDMRIYQVVEDLGAWVVLTSPECQSGTDRIAEAIHNLDYDIIVNVQGDEPLLDAKTVDITIEAILNDAKADVSTARFPIVIKEDFFSPNIVKVVCDSKNYALYFSRSPIPNLERSDKSSKEMINFWGYKHIGLYIYRRDVLLNFAKLKQSFLEKTEQLEQLRFLENGYKIKVVDALKDSIPVDTPEDILKVENILKSNSLKSDSGEKNND